eukprot:scaffold26259_cov108-Cylindrotheca_fusiformis.AAC.3
MENNTVLPISSVIHQNNTAVNLMENGEYDAAIQRLSSCLRFCASEGTTLQSDDRLQHNRETNLDRCMLRYQSCSLPSCNDFDDCDQPYVYRQPIHIASDIESGSRGKQFIASILMFNLALGHHLMFEEQDDEIAEPYLQKALMMYELAFDLQKTNEFFDSNYIFVVAILNNVATIHLYQDERDLAKQYFEQVLSILMFVIGRRVLSGCCSGSITGYQTYSLFLELVWFFPVAAAAA